MWKQLKSAFSSGDLDTVEQWGNLAFNPVFSNFGDANRAKIYRCLLHRYIDFEDGCLPITYRNLILCALRRHDAEPDSQIMGIPSATGEFEPLTIYLLFKVALVNDDLESGTVSEYLPSTWLTFVQ